ncbi:MAG: ABC transporter permease [Gemmatimonadaceae bacterium]
MRRSIRIRFFIETGLAVLTASLFALTLVRRDWIEGVFPFIPDHRDGSVESSIPAMLLVASIALTAFARVEWRRRAALTN